MNTYTIASATILLAGIGLSPSAGLAETLTSEEIDYINKHLPGVLIGPVADDGSIVQIREWFPLEETTYHYDIPGSKGKTSTLVLEQIGRAPGTPVGSRSQGWAMKLPNKTTRYLSNDKETLQIPADIAGEYGLLIKLDPPEPLLRMKGDGSLTREIDVDIYDVTKPEDVTHSGKVSCTWTDMGTHKVTVPAGTFEAKLIRVSYKGNVGPASVQARKYMFLAEDVGPVAFTDVREISAFFFYHNDTDHAGVLRKVQKKKQAATVGN